MLPIGQKLHIIVRQRRGKGPGRNEPRKGLPQSAGPNMLDWNIWEAPHSLKMGAWSLQMSQHHVPRAPGQGCEGLSFALL
jgi:uncharacterized protein (DUF2236 family)